MNIDKLPGNGDEVRLLKARIKVYMPSSMIQMFCCCFFFGGGGGGGGGEWLWIFKTE